MSKEQLFLVDEEQHKGIVLVVDDMPDNVVLLMNILSQENYKVLVARNGREAIQRTERILPDIILMDLMMPEMNGFIACQHLKENVNTAHIPIILMTALHNVEDKLHGFEVGAADYITKPFQVEEVLARVETHLKIYRLQKQLQEQSENLQKSNHELELFARTVSHNLKSPLSSIINVLDLTAEESTNAPATKKKIEWVLRVCWDMNGIINALLLLAGLSQQKNIEIQALNMNDIINDILKNRLRYEIEKKQAIIEVQENLPCSYGYAPWVTEIWMNYLTNALKYGGHPPKIRISAEILEEKTRFWVHDNGQGLSKEAQISLFNPFIRFSQSEKGTGLGLSIIRQIIERLNGEAGVESEEGQGSHFYFSLPNSNPENAN